LSYGRAGRKGIANAAPRRNAFFRASGSIFSDLVFGCDSKSTDPFRHVAPR